MAANLSLTAAYPAAAKIIAGWVIPATIIRSRSCGFGFFPFFVILFHLFHLLSYLNLTTNLKNSRLRIATGGQTFKNQSKDLNSRKIGGKEGA
jgi:hypothetical protein